jgi:UDP-glucuronate decarboxylase
MNFHTLGKSQFYKNKINDVGINNNNFFVFIYMKYILVTGGAGFIGSNLCKYLLRDSEIFVYCLDNLITGSLKNIEELLLNKNFYFAKYDITTDTILQDLAFGKIDEIYHLACIASPPKYKKYSIETLTTSFQGTKNVLDVARKYGAKFLFTSTSEVYGDPLIHPQPEEYFGNVNTLGERSCYDEGKRVGESLIYEYRRLFHVDAKIVRIFNTYGPFMDIDDGRVITNFIKQIREAKPIVIYGDGKQTRSFCYIDDMIDGLYRMMNSSELGPINIGNPYCEFTLNELVKLFENISERRVEVTYIDPTENDPKQRKPVIEKAKNLLGWQPKVGLEDGLKNTINYFSKSHN